jgi:hypothetical protein
VAASVFSSKARSDDKPCKKRKENTKELRNSTDLSVLGVLVGSKP